MRRSWEAPRPPEGCAAVELGPGSPPQGAEPWVRGPQQHWGGGASGYGLQLPPAGWDSVSVSLCTCVSPGAPQVSYLLLLLVSLLSLASW